MTAANATLTANPANSDLVIVELDGIAKQAAGAPQGEVYAAFDDILGEGGLSYSLKLSASLPENMGSLDKIATRKQGCDVIRCHLDAATMTATFDEDMNAGDTEYDFRNLTDEI